jgi:hypothetical protein
VTTPKVNPLKNILEMLIGEKHTFEITAISAKQEEAANIGTLLLRLKHPNTFFMNAQRTVKRPQHNIEQLNDDNDRLATPKSTLLVTLHRERDAITIIIHTTTLHSISRKEEE